MPLPIRHTHPSKDMHLVYRAKFLGPFLDEPLRIPAILPGGSYEGQGVRDNCTVPAAVKLFAASDDRESEPDPFSMYLLS